jgi:uncharacterized Zn finger protein
MFGWPKYVSVAERRRKAGKALEKMKKKNANLSPVRLDSSRIASTVWGKAWCHHLESFSDYANRLPRGRSYVRNGSVVHLEITEGLVKALVQGSSLYTVNIEIKSIKPDQWSAIVKDCSGRIESLVELLRGKISTSVMERMSNHTTGLFPAVGEIKLKCSCPDWADMCKHNAAVLFAVGNRLDTQPELLFKLRRVDPVEMVAGTALASRAGEGAVHKRVIKSEGLSEIFGIDIDAGKKIEPDIKSASARDTKVKIRGSKAKRPVTAKKSKLVKKPADNLVKRPEKSWVEQCRATVPIKKKFGYRKAFEYLVGEKFVSYIREAQERPEHAAEQRKFASRIKKIFSQVEIEDGLRSLHKKIRLSVMTALGESRGARSSG